MNTNITYLSLAAISIVAIIGWTFAILGFTYQQEIEQQKIAEQQEASKPRVLYSYNEEGRIPCIAPESSNNTAIYKIFLINPTETELLADFTISAGNADISWDDPFTFTQSATKRITVLAATEGYGQPFYLRPHSNADSISISTEAKAIEPDNIILSTRDPSTMTYHKNDSGNYCR